MVTVVETMNQQTLEMTRARAQEILRYASSDSDFRQKVALSPKDVLGSFGFATDARLVLSQDPHEIVDFVDIETSFCCCTIVVTMLPPWG